MLTLDEYRTLVRSLVPHVGDDDRIALFYNRGFSVRETAEIIAKGRS